MSGEMVKFEPRELPVGVAEAVGEALEDAHSREPFSLDDSRGNARRIVTILGDQYDLGQVMLYRGEMGMPGACMDRVWTTVGGCVVDSLPLNDDNFYKLYKAYIGHWIAQDMLAYELETELFRRLRVAKAVHMVIGLYPPKTSYIGEPVWGWR